MTDLSLNSAAQLLALINEENTATVPGGGLILGTHVTFGAVSVNADPEVGEGDSLVTVSSAVNSGYSGDVTVNYNRLDLEGFLAYGPAEILVPESFTMADVLASFNALYGANLELIDIDDTAPLPTPDFDGETYVLTAAAGSYAYLGDITINIYIASEALSSVITVTTLDGLTFPEPEPE